MKKRSSIRVFGAVIMAIVSLLLGIDKVLHLSQVESVSFKPVAECALFFVGSAFLLFCAWFNARFDHPKAAPPRLSREEIVRRKGRDPEAFLRGVFDDLTELERKAREKHARHEEWTETNTKPQTFDFDDGTCPYERDSSRPLGSKENPVVVGHPYASTHLVFSRERGCWILTDGLGNGWIR